jgi:hypothetical protein
MNAFQAGLYNLGDRNITAGLTDQVITEASLNGAAVGYLRLDGLKSVTLFADFVYGSGGTTAAVIVQTSLDGGQSWVDVCRFDFTTSNSKKHATIGVFGNVAPAAVAALGSEGKLDGILGDRLRAKLTTTGTYAGNTSVAVRAAAR